MKNIKRSLLLTIIFLFVYSISSPGQIFWEEISELPAETRQRTNSFSIGDFFYVGDGLNDDGTALKEWWSYDTENKVWSRIKDFPGVGRACGAFFSDGQYGYVGLGHSDSITMLNDFWRYDPQLDEWAQLNDFPSSDGLWWSTGISGSDKCYVAFGGNSIDLSYSNKIWEYTPATDSWKELTDGPMIPRFISIGFLRDNKLYVGLGGNHNSEYQDFWEYDLLQKKWTRKKDFPTIYSRSCKAFDLQGRLFVLEGEGEGGIVYKRGIYEYDPIADSWRRDSEFIGQGRAHSFSAVVNGKGYIGLGRNYSSGIIYNDVFKMEITNSIYEEEFLIENNGSCPQTIMKFADVGTEATSWAWLFEGGLPASSTSKTPVVVYNEPGVFDVSLVVNLPGGPAFIKKEEVVIVKSEPIPSMTFNKVDNTVTFTNTTVGGESFFWDFGDGNTSEEEHPTHTYNSTGNKVVRLTATNECGEQEKAITVFIATTTTVELGKEVILEVNPNPSTNNFYISYAFEASIKEGRLVLFDLMGRSIFSQKIRERQGRVIIDIDLISGVYFLRFENDEVQSSPLRLVKI